MKFKFKSRRADSNSIGGKIFASLFFFVFFAMGSTFEVMIIIDFLETVKTRSYLGTPCLVISSDVVTNKNDDGYRFMVSYQYQIDGETFTGDVYRPDYTGGGDYTKESMLLDKSPAETESVCYVDKSDPSVAILKHKSLWGGLLVLFPLLFVVIGGGGLYFLWKKSDPQSVESGEGVVRTIRRRSSDYGAR